MPRRVAFVTEDWDVDAPLEVVRVGGGSVGDAWYLGTFTASVDDDSDGSGLEGATLDEAIAWATARADEVVIRVGEDRYAIGSSMPDVPDPPHDLARHAIRRRPRDERWKDRVPEDPPIAWTVEAALIPVEGVSRVVGDAERVDAEAAQVIAAFAPDRWSAEVVEDFRAQFADAEATGERRSESGWFSWGEPRWLLWFGVEAATRELAIAAVRARAALPDGWELCARGTPAEHD